MPAASSDCLSHRFRYQEESFLPFPPDRIEVPQEELASPISVSVLANFYAELNWSDGSSNGLDSQKHPRRAP